jgi:hypothetical protein
VIRGQKELGAMAQGLLAYMDLEGKSTILQEDPFTIVLLEDGTIGALLSDREVVLSKSRTVIDHYVATKQGRNQNLRQARSFSGLDVTDVDAAVVVLAGGLGELGGTGPEARVLKLSRGVALRLSERGKDLALRVTLETDSSDNALRVQQILQGLMAIASFTQMDNQNLSTLLRTTVVRNAERLVHLEVAFPSDRVVEMIAAELPPIDLANDATGGDPLAVSVTRSSADATCCPDNLADNDPQTGWQVEGETLSATFELRAPIELETVDLGWAEQMGQAFTFTLSTSTDGSDWKRRIVWDGGGTPPNSVALAPAPAKFLQIELRRPEWGVLGLRHLRLNGTVPNLASSRSSSDAGALPHNLFDNNGETGFDGRGAPVLVEGRLDRPSEVREIGFLWGEGGEKQIQVFTSPDGIEWQRVLALAQPVGADTFQRFNARDTKARYVRIVAPDRQRWGHAREIRFYGSAQ